MLGLELGLGLMLALGLGWRELQEHWGWKRHAYMIPARPQCCWASIFLIWKAHRILLGLELKLVLGLGLGLCLRLGMKD